MTDNFKKAWNLSIWLLLLFQAFDFPVTSGLLLNLVYIAVAFIFILVALTQISFLELLSYFIIWIYSYLSNIVLALPKIEEVGTMIYGREKRFRQNDITSFQIYGTMMLFSQHYGFLMFLIWTISVLLLSFVAKSFMDLVDGTDDFGDRINDNSRHFFFSILCLFSLTFAYTESFIYTVLTLSVTLLSNEAISYYVFSVFRRFTTFFNIVPRLDVIRICLFSSLVYITFVKGYFAWTFQLVVAFVMVNVEFYIVSFIHIYDQLNKKRRRSTSSKYLTRDQLLDYSDSCPVCLGKMETAKITDCMHIFHEHCLELCLQRKPSCPVCRHVLSR